jgi:hypothetical protein
MGETNDLGRQRLTHFLAARIKARQRELNESQRANPGSGSTIPSRSEENSALIAADPDSCSREEPRCKHEHYPFTGFGSPN